METICALIESGPGYVYAICGPAYQMLALGIEGLRWYPAFAW